jgi:hypothetical protein
MRAAAGVITEAAEITTAAIAADILPVDTAVEEAEDTLPAAVTADAKRFSLGRSGRLTGLERHFFLAGAKL